MPPCVAVVVHRRSVAHRVLAVHRHVAAHRGPVVHGVLAFGMVRWDGHDGARLDGGEGWSKHNEREKGKFLA